MLTKLNNRIPIENKASQLAKCTCVCVCIASTSGAKAAGGYGNAAMIMAAKDLVESVIKAIIK